MGIIVDGKKIAAKERKALKSAIEKRGDRLGLSIFMVGSDPASQAYVKKKISLAEELGVAVYFHEFAAEDGKQALEKAMVRDAKDPMVHGMILQLPLPEKWPRDEFIAHIPQEKDVDVLTRESMALFRDGKLPILPPVVGAIQAILEEYGIAVEDKDVLVIGRGRLVGQPVSLWFRHNDARVTMVGDEVRDLRAFTKDADIIVSGAGVSRLIAPDMISEKTVLLDAGASEDGGAVVGDADARCKDVAQVFSPVPGGIGPITVSMLFKNLCILGREKTP